MHAAIAAQLPYLQRPWLFVFECDRFPGNTTAQLDAIRMYGEDAAGEFTVQAPMKDGVWQLPGMKYSLTSPGYKVDRFWLEPAGAGWTVELVVRRLPEPVVR